jgi:hypothetical protein
MLRRRPITTIGTVARGVQEEVRMILWFARAVLLFAGFNALVTTLWLALYGEGVGDRVASVIGLVITVAVLRVWFGLGTMQR